MLKLTYTETAFHIEHLSQSPEQLVALRVKLAMRMGQTMVVEPSSASFLLPVNVSTLSMLEAAVRQQRSEAIALCVADTETIEVSLTGTWITVDPEGESGIFLTVLGDRTESLLYHLWQQASGNTSVIRD
ncbi:hypothetical protein PCC9214_00862 [Planktothrix tepida]|uniref:Uncharacterized protein n=2 Tax=Planktothrix TaxID=54304 RepID=A0A1J1LHV3_9CYAN|nr:MULTISPECIES: alr0857 family protein [Planktothrix]CAD5924249.1 hypothetical protein PCC9214_00862 [Planktothrix tepida]CAD5981941.1 hypothetical protein NO713_04907 [Planktothrix pseudagardhii]CUR31161.1 conserved hypothetical protein [Planktothrix tepida PCC 9214]